MGKSVRIGIVGAGFAAQFHLASYRKVYGESFQVAAICGRSTAAARGIAERDGVPHSLDSVEAMLRDPGIDVIDICIPNHLHVPLIIEAASYGKHIICEKPL